MALFYLVTFIALFSTPAWSYSSGAPPTGCDGLGPKHRSESGAPLRSQSGPAPYKFTLAQNSVPASQPVEVQLSATGSAEIQGFMIQAQLDGKPVGTFSAESSGGYGQTLKCSADSDTLTHTKIKESKVNAVNFLWTPSADLKGKTVKLVGTVAAAYDTFWIKGVSANIQIA